MKRLILLATAAVATPALAHHPLAGQAMTTFAHGLLSGIGHPLLGFDHLFFVALAGIAAVYTGRALVAPVAYLVAMLLGCVLTTSGVPLPGIEPMIALSLLALGCIVLSGKALSFVSAMAVFALAGIFHGAAFGQSMAAAESGSTVPVLLGYLTGLGAIQYAVCTGSGWLAARAWNATDAAAIQPRLAGAVVAGAGLFLSLEHLEGFALRAIGIG